MNTSSFLSVVVLFLGACVQASTQSELLSAVAEKNHLAVTPALQTAEWTKSWWMPRHESIKARVAEGNVGMILVGDSITHRWEKGGKQYWEEFFEPLNAVNLGFRGDRTEHVLWRLENGEIEGISPKLAMVMIGTNNCRGDTYSAEEMADGIIAVCAKIRKELPQTKILLLAIFPRGEQPNELREKNALASQLASRIADGEMIHYMDIGHTFLRKDGSLQKSLMPDFVHPNTKGYQVWLEAVKPKILELMAD